MLDDLHVFVRVAEQGSFGKAADALDMPKSTVSRRVSRLEEELGLSLIHRAGRSWTLTRDGRHLVARATGPLRELADTVHAVLDRNDEPRGLLRVSVPFEFGGSVGFAGLLRDYVERYPGVELDLSVEGRLVDLVDEGVDVVLRAARERLAPRAGLIARRLTPIHAAIVAAPAYLDGRGRPTEVCALADHDLIVPAHAPFGATWPFTAEALGAEPGFEVRPRLRVRDFRSLLTAAVAGFGVGGCPLFVAQDELDAGRLERLFPEIAVPTGWLHALWSKTRHLSPRIRSFVDFVAERVAPVLPASEALPS